MSFWQIWLLCILIALLVSVLIKGLTFLMDKLPIIGMKIVMAIAALVLITIIAINVYYEQF